MEDMEIGQPPNTWKSQGRWSLLYLPWILRLDQVKYVAKKTDLLSDQLWSLSWRKLTWLLGLGIADCRVSWVGIGGLERGLKLGLSSFWEYWHQKRSVESPKHGRLYRIRIGCLQQASTYKQTAIEYLLSQDTQVSCTGMYCTCWQSP
jgi:hypothetical protein